MSTDEQEKIIGKAWLKIKEHQQTLRCLKDRAHRLSQSMAPVLQCLEAGTSHLDIDNLIARFPPREEIVVTLQEIDKLSKEIDRLKQVIGQS